MKETIKRLCEIKKYYRRPSGQCCKSQDSNMKCIKVLDTAIKALELLPELAQKMCVARDIASVAGFKVLSYEFDELAKRIDEVIDNG